MLDIGRGELLVKSWRSGLHLKSWIGSERALTLLLEAYSLMRGPRNTSFWRRMNYLSWRPYPMRYGNAKPCKAAEHLTRTPPATASDAIVDQIVDLERSSIIIGQLTP